MLVNEVSNFPNSVFFKINQIAEKRNLKIVSLMFFVGKTKD